MQPLQPLLDTLQPGDVLPLTGEYAGPGVIRCSDVTLKGDATIIGGEDGLRADRQDDLTIEGLAFRGQTKRAVFVTRSQGLTLRRVTSLQPGMIGFLTGRVGRVLIVRCRVTGSGSSHGVYLSEGGDDLTIQECEFVACAKCGIQVNAVRETGETMPSRRVKLLGNQISECGRLGAAGINLMAVVAGEVRGNRLRFNLAGGVALGDVDQGIIAAAKRLLVEGNDIEFTPGVGRYAIQIGPGSKHNRIPEGSNRIVIDHGPEIEARERYLT